MEFTPLGIEGAWLAKSPVWEDNRGHFSEWFKREEILLKTGIDFSVQQSNVSLSNRGVIRGIHYSLAPEGQAKWVICSRGAIIDYIVDLRTNSPTFKSFKSAQLRESDGNAILISAGLGHGFLSLEDSSQITYLLSSEFSAEHEFGINPFDLDLNIDWKKYCSTEFILSKKDKEAPTIQELLYTSLLPKIAMLGEE